MPKQFVTFGDRLRQMRYERKMSQEEFAKILGTSKQVLSRYETNQRTPKVTIARKFAEKLGVSLNYLLGDGDKHLHMGNNPTVEKPPVYISAEALVIALAYDKADMKCRNITRAALDFAPLKANKIGDCINKEQKGFL